MRNFRDCRNHNLTAARLQGEQQPGLARVQERGDIWGLGAT